MKIDEVLELTKGIPFISHEKRIELYNFVSENKPARILELGFAHGVSACVMAAALQECGSTAKIDAVDLFPAKQWQDSLVSIEALSSKAGLSEFIEIHRESKSYTWWLKKKIEAFASQAMTEPYDFVFIDGAHNWTIDTAAFFLSEKLLNTGGWMLFDDLNYTYQHMIEKDGRSETAGVSHYDMSEDELREPHVRLIFELLVKNHERFGEFRYSQNDDWGWAKKTTESEARQPKTYVKYSLLDDAVRLAHAIYRRLMPSRQSS